MFEGLAPTQAGSGIEIADRIAHNTIRTDRSGPNGHVLPVKNVEHLRVQPDVEFADWYVFEHGQIEVGETGTISDIAAEIAGWIRSPGTSADPGTQNALDSPRASRRRQGWKA